MPYGIPGVRASSYLEQFSKQTPIGIDPAHYAEAVGEVARGGIEGGAIYDALIALAARNSDATLSSLDRRAADTYRRCGVEFRLLDAGPNDG